MLLLGFRSDRPWPAHTTFTLFLTAEGPQASVHAPGAVRIDYEPYEHARPHLLVQRVGPDGVQVVGDQVVVRGAMGERISAFEMAFGLALLGFSAEKRPVLRLALSWGGGSPRGMTWPAGLVFHGNPGSEPPDMASAARWGRLAGWSDASGPGAISRTDWKRMRARDQEISRRGRSAHSEVRLLVEEWKKTRKEDRVLVPEVLGNLEWIARREPLSAGDLLAMATTLRYLNRHRRALGILDALVNHPDRAAAQRALYERALCLEASEAFEQAAQDWEAIAQKVGPSLGPAYTRKAAAVRAKQAPWQAEQEARAQDAREDDRPHVLLRTNRGDILIELHAAEVPQATAHFLSLVQAKFYDGTLFHRVLGDFMAQGGDPNSRELGCDIDGHGTVPVEIDLEMDARHGFWRGAVGFAHKYGAESNGSQFFLLTAPKPDLGRYTCFAHVLSGMDVVDRLERCDTLLRAEVLKR